MYLASPDFISYAAAFYEQLCILVILPPAIGGYFY